MTDADKTYNGWTNYETWCVKLWIDNLEATYQHWRERATYWAGQDSTSTYWSQEESARFNLADELRDTISDGADTYDIWQIAGMYSDLLRAALSEVNWQEIAGAMLEDVAEVQEATD